MQCSDQTEADDLTYQFRVAADNTSIGLENILLLLKLCLYSVTCKGVALSTTLTSVVWYAVGLGNIAVASVILRI